MKHFFKYKIAKFTWREGIITPLYLLVKNFLENSAQGISEKTGMSDKKTAGFFPK